MISENNLLLRALTLNAVFSGVSAILMFIAGGWLAEQFALGNPFAVYVIAGGLTVFALQLANIVRTKNIRTWEITSIIGGDIAWVAMSVVIVVLYHRTITTTALVLLDIAAVAVLIFAILQIWGLRQYRNRDARQ